MTDERTRRTAASAGAVGAEWALLTSPAAVCYATGFEVPADVAILPFSGGPVTALVTSEGLSAIVAPDILGDLPARAEIVRTYAAFEPVHDTRRLAARYGAAVLALVSELGLSGPVAVEPSSFPETLREGIGSRLVDIEPELDDARARKIPAEIDRLRRCAALTDVGQRAARQAAIAGRSELDVLATARSAIYAGAGEPVALGVDLLSGAERTAELMGAPTRRCLENGDPVLCDLVPRLDGYWGDSCTTFSVGEPFPSLLHLHSLVAHALEAGLEAARPGITAGKLDEAVRRVIARAGLIDPLHVGHGIGTANSEHPRIVPGSPTVLAPGMVLMLEPCARRPGVGGVRLEWMLLITERGNEVLSAYPVALDAIVSKEHQWSL